MAGSAFKALDSPRLTRFHRRVTILSAAGMFLDGYDITVIAVALPVLTRQWHVSGFMSGALAGSAVVGMLVGALVFGRLTDRLGRKKMYLIDLIGFVVFAALTAFAQDAWQLLIFRFLLGLALGADYSISPPLLAEYAPTQRRGSLMCRLGATWFVGAASTYVVALAFLPLGDNAWRYMLLVGALFALVVLWLRRTVPESPRWLADRGKTQEASRVLTLLTADSTRPANAGQSEAHVAPWKTLFSRRFLRVTAFCCGFWFVYTLSYYGITFYTPTILTRLTSTQAESYLGSLVVALLGVVGAFAGVALVDRIGRRPLLITGFAGLTVALAILALLVAPPFAMVVVLLAVGVLFANSGPGIVNMLYPSELYPTAVRATGTGLAAATSRAGGIIGTLAFPPLVAAWGAGHAMWVFVGAGAIGLVIALVLAPETKGHSLEELTDEPEATILPMGLRDAG